MDIEQFWKIIEASRETAHDDWDVQCEELQKQLDALSFEEIENFQACFDDYWCRAYTWDLWGAAYVIGGGCSDDGFMDFRNWLLSKGRRVYESAMDNPDSLADTLTANDDDCQFETFAYVAGQVWSDKTGKELSKMPRSGLNISSEPAGTEWSEEGDDLNRRFPKLCEKFEW